MRTPSSQGGAKEHPTHETPRQCAAPVVGPATDADLSFIGAYRFDDPARSVGMETFLVVAEGALFQVPLTYRDAPMPDGDDALIGKMEHSALGTRWVYDGLRDPTYVMSLAAATMTGQGEALGLALHDGRWYIAPAKVRIKGGGWNLDRVPVDRFQRAVDHGTTITLRNDRFELLVHRRPGPGPRPPIALTATWSGQADPVVLAEVRDTMQ